MSGGDDDKDMPHALEACLLIVEEEEDVFLVLGVLGSARMRLRTPTASCHFAQARARILMRRRKRRIY